MGVDKLSEALTLEPPQSLVMPEGYTQRDVLIEEVFRRISEGRTLTKVCGDSDMPSLSTFFRWIAGDEEKWAAFIRARESCAHVFAAQVHDEAFSAVDPALGKLRVDALKWTAGKLASKYYGESTQLRHADADGAKLDTAPLVSELLGLMSPGATAGGVADQPVKRANVPAPQVTYREVAPKPARPAYRPRGASAVDDLV